MTITLVIRDPASAVAAGKCVIARTRLPLGVAVSPALVRLRVHPRPCAWCDYPPNELADMVKAYLLTRDPEAPAERAFRLMTRTEQHERVVKAQYPEDE